MPHFKTTVTSGGEDYDVHFAALFSARPDAVPIVLLHGWPGSFLEFLPILAKVQATYPDSASLPYHLIVPSLPGYLFSELRPTQDVDTAKVADVVHALMVDTLGFGPAVGGYIAQGGDVGSGLARSLAVRHPLVVGVGSSGGEEGQGEGEAAAAGCRGALLNMLPMYPPANKDELAPPTETEKLALGRGMAFAQGGMGYAIIHGTKPSTIGLALASSPQALLAWWVLFSLSLSLSLSLPLSFQVSPHFVFVILTMKYLLMHEQDR